jgi:16S rRNA processing protein RimM
VVERRGGTDQRPTLKLRGIGSRAEVDALRGEGLWVDRADTPDLEEDEWWADDLVGLAVRDGDVEVGVVERVVAYPSCEVLVVGERLIPLIGDAVRTVDVAGGTVDVDLAFLGE